MLLTIDYLILNFKGSLQQQKHGLKIYSDDYTNPFSLVAHDYGNKTFKNVYDLFSENDKIGTIQANPRSNIIAEDLVQLQFENYLFYTLKPADLGQLVYMLVDYFALTFEGVNRLDIAIDKRENSIKYKNLYFDLLSGKKLIKGREKNISAYSVTKKGTAVFQGFTVGKRNSSRFLRIYNKTKALQNSATPKPYILDYFKANNYEASSGMDIWRFEYQLNSTFFTYLRKLGNPITYQIFEPETLIQLIQAAEKNHFEVVENTGKTETNKEKHLPLHDWNILYNRLKNKVEYFISKIRKPFEITINIQKRLCKSLLRQYYNYQETIYLYTLSKVINEYNLKDWFTSKVDFYFHEFRNKERMKSHFDYDTFNNNINLLLL